MTLLLYFSLVLGPGLVTAVCRVRGNMHACIYTLIYSFMPDPALPRHLLTQCTGATLNQYNQPLSEQPHPALVSPLPWQHVTCAGPRGCCRLTNLTPLISDYVRAAQAGVVVLQCACPLARVSWEQEPWFHLLLCVLVSEVCVVKRASGESCVCLWTRSNYPDPPLHCSLTILD